jgi:hypothetical protein
MATVSGTGLSHKFMREPPPYIVIVGMMGVALLALFPGKQPAPARPAPAGEPRFAER